MPALPGGPSLDAGEREIVIEPATSASLQDLSRSRRLTLSTLIQGAWALLLARYSGRSEVVFGVTVAGRPPELAGVETMIGMFINTLPLRVGVDESAQLVPWLLGLQDRLVELRRFEAIPLARIQGWSEVPPGQPLFESIVTVQNLPFVDTLRERADHLGVESPRYLERTHYPITVTAQPETALRIKIGFDARRFAPDAIERTLGHVRALLLSMASNPEVRLADLPWALDGEGESVPGQQGRPPGEGDWDIELPDIDRLDEGELDVLLDQLG
jgi:non-ribosomal peptide synthetase component F